jgi:hypothetical protein
MPESPDFEQIADDIYSAVFYAERGEPCRDLQPKREIIEQLRLVWNARGAADIATIQELNEAPADIVTDALRSWDR